MTCPNLFIPLVELKTFGLMAALQEMSPKASEGGKGGYLLAGWWEFIGFSCQVGQIFQNGLQVGHLTQHVDLMVLHTHINGYSGLTGFTGCQSPALVDLNHHTCSTDQYRLQHADEAAVTRSFFYQRSAHSSLLRLLQDSITHIDVLQRAVQLAPGLSLPYRNTHRRN